MAKKAQKLDERELRIQRIIEKANDPKYQGHVFKEETMVTIPGTMFAQMVQTLHLNQEAWQSVRDSLGRVFGKLDESMDKQQAFNEILQLDISEKYYEFVDNGLTTKIEENVTTSNTGADSQDSQETGSAQ